MPTLHVFGIDHSKASPQVREALGLNEPEPSCLLSGGDVHELMGFSTRNRIEVYMVCGGGSPGNPLEPLARALGSRCVHYHYESRKAAAHLFAVASALRPRMAGDTQVANELVRAAGTARLAGTLGPMLEHVVAAALRCARRVRRETGLAVRRTIHRLVPLPSRHAKPVRVLLLGAGVMAEEVAIHLLGNGITYPQITIAGVWASDKRKAIRFAVKFGVPCLSEQEAARSLHDVDAVVGACRGRVTLLSEQVLSPVLAARPNPLLVLDLGVPRNLDPCLAERDGLHAISLDQLHRQRKDRARIRQESLAQAEDIVASHAGTGFWLRQSINQSDPLRYRR